MCSQRYGREQWSGWDERWCAHRAGCRTQTRTKLPLFWRTFRTDKSSPRGQDIECLAPHLCFAGGNLQKTTTCSARYSLKKKNADVCGPSMYGRSRLSARVWTLQEHVKRSVSWMSRDDINLVLQLCPCGLFIVGFEYCLRWGTGAADNSAPDAVASLKCNVRNRFKWTSLEGASGAMCGTCSRRPPTR